MRVRQWSLPEIPAPGAGPEEGCDMSGRIRLSVAVATAIAMAGAANAGSTLLGATPSKLDLSGIRCEDDDCL